MALTERQAFRLSLAVVAAATLARALVAAHLGLGDAEAFYWCYARHLAAGYLEHPPGIAVLLRASTCLFGDGPLAVRLPGVLSSATATLALAVLAARRAGWPAGLATTLAATLAPALYAGGLSASPDPPFAAAWCLMLLAADVALARARAAPPRPGPRTPVSPSAALSPAPVPTLPLLAAGLALGVAFELKHFAVFALAAVAFLAATDPTTRRLARRPAFLGAAVLAVLAAVPHVAWNAARGWPTVLNRFVWQQGAAGFSPLNLLRLAGGQLGYLSPLLYVALLAVLVRLWRAAPRDEPLFSFAVWPLGLAYLVALWTPRAEPHWPLVGTYALFAAAGPAWVAARDRPRWRRFGVAAAALAAVLIAALHVLVLTDAAAGLYADPRHDLSNELRGWDAVAGRVRALRAPGEPVVSYHYTMCAQLEYALREDVRCLSPDRTDDFDLWGAGALPPGARAFLFVGDNRYDQPPGALYPWARCGAPLESFGVIRAGRAVRTFRLWRCIV
jgi:4-amino-4-deoxy-L-arabinose transferase-like glycosyltransferase